MVETEPKTGIEQLRYVADWLEAHDCDGLGGGVWPTGDGIPQVFLPRFKEMQRLFPGVPATRKRETSRFCYTLTADGIRFSASEWIEPTSSGETEQVTL